MARFFVVLLAAVLTACSQPLETLQDSYASMPDCLRDWSDPALCAAEPDQSQGAGKKSVHFWGPRYLSAERVQLVRGDDSQSRRLATRKGGNQGKLVRAEKKD
jgi:hypothetical protein